MNADVQAIANHGKNHKPSGASRAARSLML
jgi:hypothetical protein